MGKILLAHQDGVKVLKFVGDVRLTLGPAISAFVKQIGSNPELRAVVIDLTEAESIDSTALGLLAKISLRSQESLGALPTIVSSNDDINWLTLCGMETKVWYPRRSSCSQPQLSNLEYIWFARTLIGVSDSEISSSSGCQRLG